MQAPMMPPPLPGYPGGPPPQAAPAPVAVAAPPFAAPAAPYAPQPPPQGYPGPAVAAPAPPPQPQPGQPYPAYTQPPQPQFAAPPQQQQYAAPQPVYGQPPQQYAAPPAYGQPPQPYGSPPQYAAQPAPAGFDLGAAIAGATGGDRLPTPSPGSAYEWDIIGSECTQGPLETGGKFTFKMYMKVRETFANGSPVADPPGKEVAYIEGMQWGAGRAQEAILAGCGYPSKAHFDHAMATAGRDPVQALKDLASACGKKETSPLTGRRVAGAVTINRRTPKQGRNAGIPQDYLAIAWSPR